ncbi:MULTISPECIES: hypothetical protein [Rummeliibacillus]|uniref:hypothetical protein n=1 Tax=Rummeliibacillus TaxID=648802 RepID=UPI0011B7505C|nr:MULTISPECIES: hypothetical protein [Rummeliibacillus]MBO2535689.1 hypothetical protein [Rummeliibacillus suwonensis]
MNVIEGFLQSEINTQGLYEDIMNFITSYHIRNGEFEGNEYIIKKMDQTNFIIFPEYEDEDGEREIHAAEAVYRGNLIKRINEYALTKDIKLHYKEKK